ncbi:hypothetical protein [Acrocarpospora sp. B8E8]|uniref:hypothetical protein n=1 Tax=Acrocarpospora sp. B8E8 TaxID=3153572 RepID=UPI00325FCD1C
MAAFTLYSLDRSMFLSEECSSENMEIAPGLASYEIFDVHPEGASSSGGASVECDEDDDYVYAGKSYKTSDGNADILSYYKDAAQADGWRPMVSNAPSPPPGGSNSLCFSKPMGDTAAYFSVHLDGEVGAQTRSYWLMVAAAHDYAPQDGDGLC